MALWFNLPAWSSRMVSRLIHLQARVTRPMTLGVRAVILDDEGRVLLVRHSYVPGWHFPGGGVEPGETLHQALVRETREEAGIEIEGAPALLGLFFNRNQSRRDHVAVYVVRRWRFAGPRADDWEIAESGFFHPASLPRGTSVATRARLDEIAGRAPLAAIW